MRRLVFLLLLFTAVLANANTYSIVFTDSPVGGNVVGNGTFSFTDSLGDGTYYLTSLTSYNIDFTVGTSTFTNADINTSIPDVLVVIYGGGLQFYFDNDGVFGSHGGSLDFDKADGSYLTTEPNYYGPPPLDLYQALDSSGNLYFGMYGVPVPEPSSLLLVGTGLLGAIGLLKKRFL